DFLKEVKKSHPLLPVIVVTASTNPQVMMEAVLAQAFKVCLKPIDRDDFQRSVLAARKMRAALESRSQLQRRVDAYRIGMDYLAKVLESTAGEVQRAVIAEHGLSSRALQSLPSGLVVFDLERKVR